MSLLTDMTLHVTRFVVHILHRATLESAETPCAQWLESAQLEVKRSAWLFFLLYNLTEILKYDKIKLRI